MILLLAMRALYWEHLKTFACHLRQYSIAYLLLAALLCSMIWRQEQRIQKSQQISTWPTTSAIIKGSTVGEYVHASQDSPPETRISIALEIQFEIDGTTYQKNLFTSFNRHSNTDYNALLAPENNIKIKYNPENPSQISLSPLLPD
ncbi:MAG: DUF3592 domain-containing protein [Verrucomicrobiota bacterium]